MKIIVQNPTVTRNIDLFKKVAKRLLDQKKMSFQEKELKGFVNCHTGEIYFGELLESNGKKWQPICLFIGNEGNFLIIGLDESQFSIKDFSISGYRSMIETMRVLNLTLQLVQSRRDPELFLATLNAMEFTLSKDIIHDTWHQVDRIGAERLLHEALPGTFFFRKDEYASLLEAQVTRELRAPIKCVTLSYLDPKCKVVDKTVVKRDNSWLFYNDDPSLEGPLHADVLALLDSLGDEIFLPLAGE